MSPHPSRVWPYPDRDEVPTPADLSGDRQEMVDRLDDARRRLQGPPAPAEPTDQLTFEDDG